jgi:carbon-monoxide dehydrogenase large subunit
MEPRGCIGGFDAGTGRYTLYTSTQNVRGVRQGLALQILHVPESRIRVVARDVGGGFGMKGQVYPEEAVVIGAARRVGRLIKWIPSRSEAMIGGNGRRGPKGQRRTGARRRWKVPVLRWPGLPRVSAYIEGAGCVPIPFA